ncbi:MAG: hypothetical protein PGN16_08560 [Sphingomonas phyllosphaerae]|uniref:hypothetical protein n=1 Tax=Sphingomonas phyllosphaerae TaxID=257003 RepID=UPI002FF72A5D
MKRLINWSLVGVLLMMLYGIGYGEGARAARRAAAQTCAREMTPICAAVLLANLKQVERIIAAKNRKPIVVECRR